MGRGLAFFVGGTDQFSYIHFVLNQPFFFVGRGTWNLFCGEGFWGEAIPWTPIQYPYYEQARHFILVAWSF